MAFNGSGNRDEGEEFGSTMMNAKGGQLTVWQRKAGDIKGTERLGMGRADPYALLSLGSSTSGPGKQQKLSKSLRNAGSKPVWDERFEFAIEENSRFDKNILYIILKDKDHLTKDDLLGDLMIDIPMELAQNQGHVPLVQYPVYYRSELRGYIELSLSFREVGPNIYGEEPRIRMNDSERVSKGVSKPISKPRNFHSAGVSAVSGTIGAGTGIVSAVYAVMSFAVGGG